MVVTRKDNRINVSLTLKEAASLCKHRTHDGWMLETPVVKPIADPEFAKRFRTNLATAIRRTGIFDRL